MEVAAGLSVHRQSLTASADEFGNGLAKIEAELHQLHRQFEEEFQARFSDSKVIKHAATYSHPPRPCKLETPSVGKA